MPAQQLKFQGFSATQKKAFGGSRVKGNPKTARPIATRAPMHIVMRSSQARGQRSLLMNAKRIEQVIRTQAHAFGVRVYDFANAGNHLHLVVLFTHRRTYRGFMRSIAGLIARISLGAERGRASTLEKFWDARPFSRILGWGREYKGVRSYLMINRLETAGFERLSARAMFAEISEAQRECRLAPMGFS